jgi:hypothetical protein
MKLFALVLWMLPAAALAVTPVNGGAAPSGTDVTINDSSGDQTLPHVSGNLAAYTDVADAHIHYFDFNSLTDAFIAPDGSLGDTLSDVGDGRVAFTRQTPTNDFEVAVFDTNAMPATTTVIDPHPGDLRLGSALGNNTLCFVDFGTGTGSGDIWAVVLPGMVPVAISTSPLQEQNPNVSPDGNAIVWEQCPTASNCDVMKSVATGGVWSAPEAVVNTTVNEENPDTDGTSVVYDADKGAATGRDIYIHSLSGPAAEVQVELAGAQVNPSISDGIIGFESTVPPSTTPDIFVYVVATNTVYQVTNTPDISEQLNDITSLGGGIVRVVWAADDGPAHELNIYGTTFTVPLPTMNMCLNRSTTLDASRTTGFHTSWSDAHQTFSPADSFALPASIPVVQGNAGNKHLTLSWTTDCGVQQKCHYRGENGGADYGFDHCEGPGANSLHAGSVVVVTEVRLHVDDAGLCNHHTTEVRVTLAEACAAPSTCSGQHGDGDDDDDGHCGGGDDDGRLHRTGGWGGSCNGHHHDSNEGHSDEGLSVTPQPTAGCSAAGAMMPAMLLALAFLLLPRRAKVRATRRTR